LCEVQGYAYAAYLARAELAAFAGDDATRKRCPALDLLTSSGRVSSGRWPHGGRGAEVRFPRSSRRPEAIYGPHPAALRTRTYGANKAA
jgi:hypothetical protein